MELLESMSALLSRSGKYELAGQFSSAEEALKGFKNIEPELVIVDLGLPGMSGLELIEQIRNEYDAIRIIAFTGNEDRDVILAAIKAGAQGYIIKGSGHEDLLSAIEELSHGGAPMSSRVAKILFSEIQDRNSEDEFLLSRREKDVLEGIRQGLTYNEIGDLHHISPNTVHSHIKRIFKKLGAEDRREALTVAKKKGII